MTGMIAGTHSHVFLGKGHETNERRTWMVIALCSFMMAAEIVGGLLFGSIALVADGCICRRTRAHCCSQSLASRSRPFRGNTIGRNAAAPRAGLLSLVTQMFSRLVPPGAARVTPTIHAGTRSVLSVVRDFCGSAHGCARQGLADSTPSWIRPHPSNLGYPLGRRPSAASLLISISQPSKHQSSRHGLDGAQASGLAPPRSRLVHDRP